MSCKLLTAIALLLDSPQAVKELYQDNATRIILDVKTQAWFQFEAAKQHMRTNVGVECDAILVVVAAYGEKVAVEEATREAKEVAGRTKREEGSLLPPSTEVVVGGKGGGGDADKGGGGTVLGEKEEVVVAEGGGVGKL